MSDGHGSMGANPRKQQPNHPDFKGQVTIDGTEYWLSGWNKRNERGEFISLALEKKSPRSASRPGYQSPASERMGMQQKSQSLDGFEGDTPF